MHTVLTGVYSRLYGPVAVRRSARSEAVQQVAVAPTRRPATSFFFEATQSSNMSMRQSGYGSGVELTTVFGYLVFLFGLGVGLWLTYASMTP